MYKVRVGRVFESFYRTFTATMNLNANPKATHSLAEISRLFRQAVYGQP